MSASIASDRSLKMTFSDENSEVTDSSFSDTLSTSAALNRRREEREHKMKAIEKAFQNVMDETHEGEKRIYQSVFAESGTVHDEDILDQVENFIVDAEPKTKLGKFGKMLNPWKKTESDLNFMMQSDSAAGSFGPPEFYQGMKTKESPMETDLMLQSDSAGCSFEEFLPSPDFQEGRNNNYSVTPVTVRDTLIYQFRQHGRKILIITAILLSIIVTFSTLVSSTSRKSTFMNMNKQMYGNFQAIQEELINQGVKKDPLIESKSSQFAALMQLSEEATAGKLSISTIIDGVSPVVETNSHGDPANFNDAYKERRILAERYALLTFHHSTTTSNNTWRNRDNWLSNDKAVCDGWHGITCRELLGDSVAVQVVISISLALNGLTGTIPEDVSRLSQLEVLSLEGNFLEGELPKSLGTLEHLKSLRLSNNLLSGEVPSSVCSLRENKHLTELISDCGGGGGDIECNCCTECL